MLKLLTYIFDKHLIKHFIAQKQLSFCQIFFPFFIICMKQALISSVVCITHSIHHISTTHPFIPEKTLSCIFFLVTQCKWPLKSDIISAPYDKKNESTS